MKVKLFEVMDNKIQAAETAMDFSGLEADHAKISGNDIEAKDAIRWRIENRKFLTYLSVGLGMLSLVATFYFGIRSW